MPSFIRRLSASSAAAMERLTGSKHNGGSREANAGAGNGWGADGAAEGMSPQGVALAERWLAAKANKGFLLECCKNISAAVLVTGRETTASRTLAKACAAQAAASRERRAASSDATLAYSQAREETDGFRARYAAALTAAAASMQEAAAGRQYELAKEQRKRVEQLRAELAGWHTTLRQKRERLRTIGHSSRESAEVEAKAHVAEQRVNELTRSLASAETEAARAVGEVVEAQEAAIQGGMVALAEAEAAYHAHCATAYSNTVSALGPAEPAGPQSRYEMLTAMHGAADAAGTPEALPAPSSYIPGNASGGSDGIGSAAGAYPHHLQPYQPPHAPQSAAAPWHPQTQTPQPPQLQHQPHPHSHPNAFASAASPAPTPTAPRPVPLNPRVLARADRNYVPRSASELVLERGGYVVVRKDTGEHGWLQGESFGEIGWFPASHVTLVGEIPE